MSLIMPVPFWFGLVLPSHQLQLAQSAHVEGRPALALYSAAAAHPGFLRAEINEKYAIALMDVGDYESARDRFKDALRGSDSGSVYLGLGMAEFMLGNRAAAYEALQKAVYRWPSHLNAWRLLMRVCPAADREAWLGKAKRFLWRGEIAILEKEPTQSHVPSAAQETVTKN